jgi:hypothetical protein
MILAVLAGVVMLAALVWWGLIWSERAECRDEVARQERDARNFPHRD